MLPIAATYPMTNLDISATASTPTVVTNFDAGTMEMRGDSYPENSFEFFAPLVEWVQTYLKKPDSAFNLDLYLLYLNTSSVRAMMDIFELLEDAHHSSHAVAVRWFYDEDNDRIAELAEEFKEDCSFSFEILPNAA